MERIGAIGSGGTLLCPVVPDFTIVLKTAVVTIATNVRNTPVVLNMPVGQS